MTGQSIQQRITRPDEVVRKAAMMRWEHYVDQGADPLPWTKLTDAQKLPWLLQASFEALGLTQEWAARFVDGSVTVGSEGTARYCASHHPDTWQAVSRYVTSWEATNG